jgi:hypothetical protein
LAGALQTNFPRELKRAAHRRPPPNPRSADSTFELLGFSLLACAERQLITFSYSSSVRPSLSYREAQVYFISHPDTPKSPPVQSPVSHRSFSYFLFSFLKLKSARFFEFRLPEIFGKHFLFVNLKGDENI